MNPASKSPLSCLILPFASASAPECTALLDGLKLPNLSRLLGGLRAGDAYYSDDYTFNTPSEQARAHLLGWRGPDGAALADGELPLAAAAAGVLGKPCAWFSPCVWMAGMEQIAIETPSPDQLNEAESRSLFDALHPLCAEDGIELTWASPTRWLAIGQPLSNVATASLDRVRGRHLHGWLPRGPNAAGLLRLQNEAQMLFYTHPVNDRRAERGEPAINGLWISATGVLPANFQIPDCMIVEPEELRVCALQGDWRRWAEAWQRLDALVMTDWLAKAQKQEPMTVVLCGERGWRSWSNIHGQSHWFERWLLRFKGDASASTYLKNL